MGGNKKVPIVTMAGKKYVSWYLGYSGLEILGIFFIYLTTYKFLQSFPFFGPIECISHPEKLTIAKKKIDKTEKDKTQ